MIADLIDARAPREHAASLLAQVAADFKNKAFAARRFLRQADAQTVPAYFWPTRLRLRDPTGAEERLFEVEPQSRVVARCQWHTDRTRHPTLVMWHGLEGSATAGY